MKKHNTLFSNVTPPTTKIARPKKVFTTPVQGNLGKGLTSEQYHGILNNIGDLQDKTAVQRADYNAYVEKNEKATVRSDYNIADITELAKSLELLIYDLQNKFKVQDKWNAIFKQSLKESGDPSSILAVINGESEDLKRRIAELERKLSDAIKGNQDLFNSQSMSQDSQSIQIQNLIRILQELPGFVTNIESICNKADGGFELKYKTIKFDNINLDAELPQKPPSTDSTEEEYKKVDDGRDYDGDEQFGTPDPEGEKDDGLEKEEIVTDPMSSAETAVTVSSPTDMKFNALYAEQTKLTDVNKSLTEMKNAITSLQSSTPTIVTLFSAMITVYAGGPGISSKLLASDALSLSVTRSPNQWNLTVTVSSTSLDFTLASVVTSTITARGATSFEDDHYQSRGDGPFSSIVNRISSSSSRSYSVDLKQYSQGDGNNDSWGEDQWNGKNGVFQFYIVGFGTIGTVAGQSPTVNVTIPNAPEFTASCGERVETPIEPTPEPEPEPAPEET